MWLESGRRQQETAPSIVTTDRRHGYHEKADWSRAPKPSPSDQMDFCGCPTWRKFFFGGVIYPLFAFLVDIVSITMLPIAKVILTGIITLEIVYMC